jgi:hypothetical protein
MHTFQPSRGRILFEVLCAVGIAASCGGAWIQTGASALLAASSLATLYGLVHFFDLFRSAPAVAVEPQRIEFAADGQADLSAVEEVADVEELVPETVVAIEPLSRTDNLVEIAEPVEPPAPKARRAKVSRKGGASPATAPKKAKTAEVAIADVAKVAGPSLAEVAEVAGTVILEPAAPVPHAPLFEPEPFARMPRQSFGRRGQI